MSRSQSFLALVLSLIFICSLISCSEEQYNREYDAEKVEAIANELIAKSLVLKILR